MNLEQKKFEEWKRRHGKLDEGFLDGNDDLETADVPSEDVASEEEKDLSEEPSEDDVEGGDYLASCKRIRCRYLARSSLGSFRIIELGIKKHLFLRRGR